MDGLDKFETRYEKQVGQALVFRREDYLTPYETESLYPTPEKEPEQQGIEFPAKEATSF